MKKILGIILISYVLSSSNLSGEHYEREDFHITCKGNSKERLVSGDGTTKEWESEFDFLINVESFKAPDSNRELFTLKVGASEKSYSNCYSSGNRAHIVCVESEESDKFGLYHKIKISRVSGRYVEDLHTFSVNSSDRSEYHMAKRGQCKKIEIERDT